MLLHGNCLDLLPTLEPQSIDLVICDLPYGQTDAEWDSTIDLVQLWTNLKRVIKPRTPIIFFTTTKYGFELIQTNKPWFRYDLVWSKDSTAGFLNSKKMPMRTHEMIYVFYEQLPTVYTDNILRHHHHVKPFVSSIESKESVKGVYGGTKLLKGNGGRPSWQPMLPTSILHHPTNKHKKSRNHPTEKPTSILKWLIDYYSKEGDTILDPTMGCGSTGVACHEMGRNFVGIELSKEFYDIACLRLNQN